MITYLCLKNTNIHCGCNCFQYKLFTNFVSFEIEIVSDCVFLLFVSCKVFLSQKFPNKKCILNQLIKYIQGFFSYIQMIDAILKYDVHIIEIRKKTQT